MTREDEIKELALEYCGSRNNNDCSFNPMSINDLIEFGKLIDSHPGSPWISVEDKLPHCKNEVLGLFDNGEVVLCEYSYEEKIWSFDMFLTDPPIYWMPIPELPKLNKND